MDILKHNQRPLKKNEAVEIFKKAKDSGIPEFSGKQVEIWTESYPTVQNE